MRIEDVEEFVRRGQAADRAVTLALYRGMSTRELRQLHAAFVADKQSAQMHQGNEQTIAFCDCRLALIDEVLKTRKD
jgi:hypothetical protein